MFERGLTPRQKDDLDRHITGNYGEGALSDCEDEEWLSECCGAPPHETSPDVDGDEKTGICGSCREHTGFELYQ